MQAVNDVPAAAASPPATPEVPQTKGRARSHHLLKHTLPVLDIHSHFGTVEPKEVTREINRMGQRELQQKFREVYKTPTFSNNNNWLRRKLMEAAGVQAPKASGRGRPSVRSPAKNAAPRTLGVRAHPSSSSPTSSRSTGGEGPKSRCLSAQQVAGEVRRTNRVRKPPQVYDDMLINARAGSVSSDDTTRSLQHPYTSALRADHLRMAFGLGYEQREVESVLGRRATGLLAQHWVNPMPTSASRAVHDLQRQANMILHPAYRERALQRAHLPATFIPTQVVPHTPHCSLRPTLGAHARALLHAQTQTAIEPTESDVSIGTYERQGQGRPGDVYGDARAPLQRRTSSFDSITSSALMEMRSPHTRPNTALLNIGPVDRAAMPLAHISTHACHSGSMASEPHTPLAESFVPKSTACSPLESCGTLLSEADADGQIHLAGLLQDLESGVLQPEETISAIDEMLESVAMQEFVAEQQMEYMKESDLFPGLA